MNKFYSLVVYGLLTVCAAQAQKREINTLTELDKLGNIADLPKYWDRTTVHQFSSYDRTDNNDDGFSGKYSFIRKETDGSLVIFEAEGNGVINRIWTPTPTNDTLDLYFSGATKPQYSIRFSDLYNGKVSPFVSPLAGNELGGFYSYMPIPYKDGCKVVFRGKKLEFYQIQYRTYQTDDQVVNFDPKLPGLGAALAKLDGAWKDPMTAPGVSLKVSTKLTPGKTFVLADLKKPGRITGIKLHHSDLYRGLNKNILIKMTWDGERPAVYMPVADFFGYAFGKESMQSVLLGSANNINYCYFPMPFARSAKIELIYRQQSGIDQKPIDVEAELFVAGQPYNAKTEGKFYAQWNPEKHTTAGKPHVFLEGNGKGHYVGTILQAQGLEPGMTLFFEGDDVTRIDGELRMHGTGSEDYFNGGWYALLDRWDTKMSLPLHGSLDYSLPFARTGGYRLFIADKMPFEKSIIHTIEHGPEQNNKPGDYTSVAFYYAPKAITTDQPVPTDDLVRVRIPDTLMVYPQLIKYSVGGGVKIEGHILHSTNGGQVKIDLSDLPKGSYKLYADIEKTPDGATVSIWQRQKMINGSFSFYADKRENAPNTLLCDIDLDDFKDAITLQFKRDDKKSIVSMHRLILVRQK
ncbi:glycoside hydrolase family 172 protein [Mucilaginibacter myungsuensis]|uniref:DUF2961 domain-containing protein n=1 Tax=Mucilaginibacter myungsuensis TaxID=649104 RepID=A0A929L783_9SPHI|nr:glycoside hydrolase family 172 protein [Mucilaginibacter myungsuensis]MBE9664456.1 DUF2961 domain-containing protein [Mucilaginibacter myungsuensis]MDN3601399.1 DUF2961 domain-containing protein [Mucilaginibacter myungsuensis]